MTSKLPFKPKGSPHEIVRYIRANYRGTDENDFNEQDKNENGIGVQTRTSKIFLTNVTDVEKARQDKFDRKKTTLRQGYFTHCTEPYRSVGGSVQELSELIYNAVGPSLCEKARLEFKKESDKAKNGSKPDFKSRRQSSKPPDLQKSDDAILKDSVRSHIKNAGFDEIRKALAATKRRLTTVKCSTAFATTVKREQEAKKLAKEEKEMNESQGMVLSRLPSDFLCTIDVERIPSTDGRSLMETVNKEETQFEIQYSGKDDDFKSQPKRVRTFLQKLKCVLILLTSVGNLRNKYLKSKVALKWDLVKQLRQEAPTDRDKDTRASQAWSLAIQNQISHQVRVSTSTLLSTADSKLNNGVGSPTKLHLPPIKARGSIIDSIFHPNRRNKHQRRMLNEFRLDTWEDLLVVNPAESKRVKSQKKVPPWQQSWGHDRPKSKVEKQSVEESMQEIIEDDQWDRFERHKDYLIDVKNTFRRQVEKKLAKLERERLYKGKRRLRSLNTVYPMWSQQLFHLREATCLQNILSQNKGSSIAVELAQWFIQLKNESVNLNLEEDKETQRRLSSLERFASEDLEATPLITEKLCLLVSSLPAHEICTPQMQNAIKLVLGEVLVADDPHDILRRWLQYRNLYVLSP